MGEHDGKRKRTRAYGDGSIYQRASDGLWVGAVILPTGKRRPVYGKTRNAARDKMRDLQREIDDGTPITSGRGVTLGRYLEQWLAVTLPARVKAGRLAPATLESYRDNTELHIIPHLGRGEMSKLSPVRVRTWLAELQDKPSARARRTLRPGETELPEPPKLSARTVTYCHAILRKALADAVRDEIIGRNVATLVEPPAGKSRKLEPPSKDEARALLAAAAGHRLGLLWLIILALGLRRGEALGLGWEQVDLEAGTVTLEKSLQRRRGEKDPVTGRRKGELVESDLKTDASHATLALPYRVLVALRQHKAAQREERIAAKVWTDSGLVFTTSIGTALEPRNVSRLWDEVCDAAGVRRFRIHDLRHATATYMFAEGVEPKTVQATLRHTRLATTSDVYTHVLTEVHRAAASSMDDVLSELDGKRRRRRKKA